MRGREVVMREDRCSRPAAHQDESSRDAEHGRDGPHHIAVDDRTGQHLGVDAVDLVGAELAVTQDHQDSPAGLVEVDETAADRAVPSARDRADRSGTGTGWARCRPATPPEARSTPAWDPRAPWRSRRRDPTRQRLRLTGRPRFSSASSSSPPVVDRDGEEPGTRRSACRHGGVRDTSGSARLRGWVSSTTSRGEPVNRPGAGGPASGPGSATGRSPRAVRRGIRVQLRRVDRLAAVAGRRQLDDQLAARGLPGQGHRRAGQHEPDVSPGAHPLIEQQHELLGHRAARRLAVEIQQLALGEPAEELLVLERELDRQDLLGRAAGRQVPVAVGLRVRRGRAGAAAGSGPPRAG